MSREKSLIPSVYDFMSDADSEIVQHEDESTEVVYTTEVVMSLLKEYGEEVRRITLQEAADKAKIKGFDDEGDFFGDDSFTVIDRENENKVYYKVEPDKESILKLNESDRLNIS